VPRRVRLPPAFDAEAPAIPRLEARKMPGRHGGDEVVANGNGVIEKIRRHEGADGVEAAVIRAGLAVAIAEKAGHRVSTAKL